MLASSFSTRFLLRKNRRSRLPAPLGPLFCRPRHGCAAPGPQRQNPGPPRFQLGFCCAKIGAAGYRPHLLGLPRKSGRGISLRETTLCGCPLRGHGFATPHRCFAVPVTAPPRRAPNGKTPALAPIRSHFAPRNRAAGHRPHRGRCFGLPRFRFAQARSPGQNPGACSHSVAFRLRRNRAAGRCPRRGQRARYPIFAPRNRAGRSSAPPGPMFCRPRHGSAAPGPQRQNPGACSRSVAFRLRRNRAAGHRPHRGRCFAVPVTAPPRRVPNGKTPALLVFNPVFSAQKPAGASPRFRTAGR